MGFSGVIIYRIYYDAEIIDIVIFQTVRYNNSDDKNTCMTGGMSWNFSMSL